MGRLTDDMTRLVGEMHTGHDERRQFVSDLKVKVADMRKEVATEIAARRVKVADMLKEVATEMAGARKAWTGVAAAAMPGRTRRGGKWFGGESA